MQAIVVKGIAIRAQERIVENLTVKETAVTLEGIVAKRIGLKCIKPNIIRVKGIIMSGMVV